MKTNCLLNNRGGGRAKVHLIDKITGKKTLVHDWKHNLIFDSALNSLAGGNTGFANLMNFCLVGSGTNPNEFNASGSAIFTQVGNTITAASTFFTSAMIGGIFKYGGTGVSTGAEQYITTVGGGGLTCTVSGAGMTVATPTAGATWMVQQTALQTFLYNSNVVTSSTNNQANNGTLTLTQIYTFNESATYSVNEIGYHTVTSSGTCSGRIVLGSTVNVSSSQILSVTIEFVWNQTPNAPLIVTNVGTGMNTAGQIMLNEWSSTILGSTNQNFRGAVFDAPAKNTTVWTMATGTAPTLNASIGVCGSTTSRPNGDGGQFAITGWTNSSQPVGVSVASGTYSSTTSGLTSNGFIIGNANGPSNIFPSIVLLFTTPVTLPTGSFAGTFTFSIQFSRTLVN